MQFTLILALMFAEHAEVISGALVAAGYKVEPALSNKKLLINTNYERPASFAMILYIEKNLSFEEVDKEIDMLIESKSIKYYLRRIETRSSQKALTYGSNFELPKRTIKPILNTGPYRTPADNVIPLVPKDDGIIDGP